MRLTARLPRLAVARFPPAPAPRRPWVELKGKRFSVEVADDDAERARGLMFRDEMEADHGMLFVHDGEEPQAYWMKNTRIPLDILYFDDHERKLVSAAHAPPCSLGDRCPPFPSEGPARTCSSSTPAKRSAGLAGRRRAPFGPASRAQVALDLQRAARGSTLPHARPLPLPDWNSSLPRRRRTSAARHRAADRARRIPAARRRRLRREVQDLRRRAAPQARRRHRPAATLTAINRYLFEELGFAGNTSTTTTRATATQRGLRPQARQPDLAGGGADRADAPARPAARRRFVSRPFPGAIAGRRRHPGDGSVQQGPAGRAKTS
jgi:uncharacterized membrane protein (UPF0127 family)